MSSSSKISFHDGAMDRTITMGLEDGSEYTDVVLLDDAHEAWEILLTGHGLL
jgi:activator of 2-hydroxyglutaryl-CoA dehydratase